jgi:hypothetical protein
MDATVKTYSAIDLLDKVFEFIEMTPNSNEWNRKALKSNPPREIRFRQIEALLNAFFTEPSLSLLSKAKLIFSNEKKNSIGSFLKGDFLKQRTMNDYSNLVAFIRNFEGYKDTDVREISIEQLVFIFPKLVDFKRQVRSILTFNSGWLEASSITSLFSIHLTNSIADNLTGKYKELDTALELFINPKGLLFTTEELITKFDFPKEDLDTIDNDFIMKASG